MPLNIDTVGITDDEVSSIVLLFPSVESIGFERPSLGNMGLSYLSQLESLTQLRIYGDELPDISPLASCRQLVTLDIDSSGFGDDELAALKGIPSLGLLMLFRTRVTPRGLTALKDKLPSCEIVVFAKRHSDEEQFANLQYDPIQKKFVHIEVPTSGADRKFVMPSAR